jgi:hypothetical protein
MSNGRMWVVTALMAAAFAVAAAEARSGAEQEAGVDGGAPYTPTKAEWLCVLLNVDRAVTDGSQFASSGIVARFRCDHTRPDTIQVELIYPPRAPKRAVRYRARQAEQEARKMAALKGWDGWLKTVLVETEIPSRPGVEPLVD